MNGKLEMTNNAAERAMIGHADLFGQLLERVLIPDAQPWSAGVRPELDSLAPVLVVCQPGSVGGLGRDRRVCR